MSRPTLHEICQILHAVAPSLGHEPITGVATDSRMVSPGQLFVALKGLQVDGHDYVKQALDNGAIAALVSDQFTLPNAPLIRVKDPLLALQAIARWHVAKSRAQVVAITGSLGKTTTKEFLYALLKSKYKTACTSGNQNSQVGMSASLINNVQGDEEYIVVEMGMTQAGHIKQLVDIVPPAKALLTEIALVHAENFESIEGIARAKAEIFSHPNTTLALISKDAPCSELLQNLSHAKTMFYSMKDPRADFYLEVRSDSLYFLNQKLPFISLPAPHVYQNLLAACAMASCCNMSAAEIGMAFCDIKMPEKRLEACVLGGISFINDSYNAAEPSLKAALSYIKTVPNAKRKIAVIGQMRELGSFSESCHRSVGLHALDCVDKLYCLGQECAPIVEVCQTAGKPCLWFTDFSELAGVLKHELMQGDLVLLKGSRSNGLWRILDTFT